MLDAFNLCPHPTMLDAFILCAIECHSMKGSLVHKSEETTNFVPLNTLFIEYNTVIARVELYV
jgi:hypothetical protein